MTEESPRLKLIVRMPDGQESETYLDWEMIVGLPELLLPNVQQLAWDMRPDAEEILAMYIDDEGDRCTLTESTAADALSFTKPGGDEAEKVLEVIVRAISTDATDVDLEAATEVDEAFGIASSTAAPPEAAATATVNTLEQYGSEPQPSSSSGDEQSEALQVGSCSSKTTTTPSSTDVADEGAASCEDFAVGHALLCKGEEALAVESVVELGVSIGAAETNEALSAPPVEVMGESPTASAEPTTVSAPMQHRFVRQKVAWAEPAQEDAPVQHRFARHKAEDLQRFREEVELYIKQAEEARLEAENVKKEAEAARAAEETLRVEISSMKADGKLEMLREELMMKIQENEDLHLQMNECKQAHEEEAKKLQQLSSDASRELEKKLAEVESERCKVEKLSVEAAEAKEQLCAAHVQIEEMKIQVAKSAQEAEEAAVAAGQAAAIAQAAEEARRQQADMAGTAAAQVAQQHAELLRSKEVEVDELKVVEQKLKSLVAAKSAEADKASSTMAQVRAELQNSQARCDSLEAALEQNSSRYEDLQGKGCILQAKLKEKTTLCDALQAKVREQSAAKQSKASALVMDSQPLLFGIEAEEEPSARCDVTARSAEVLAKLSARQAFCIGRVRLAAGGIEPATGRPLAAVPASVMITVANNGSIDWPATAVIANVGDDCLGAPVIPLGPVPPGGSKEVEMDLNVPSKPEATTAQYLWAVMDARTSAVLGAVLIFEAVWDSP